MSGAGSSFLSMETRMSLSRNVLPFLALLVLLGGCASATKRLEQGMDMELRGNYDAASARYVQALQKDPSLTEARRRLVQVTDHAVDQHLQDAGAWGTRGDGVRAATEYRAVDGLVGNARSVGVSIDLPADYEAQRRDAYDQAIAALFTESEIAASRGQYQIGVNAARRARLEFEPDARQRQDALDQEARVLATWSEAELDAGHLRAAYGLAADVQALGAAPSVHEDAAYVMHEALALGRIDLMALPVVAVRDDGKKRRGRDKLEYEEHVADLIDLETRVNAELAHGPFRAPSPFVNLTDPIRVREVVRQAGLLEGGIRSSAMGLLIRAVDAEYGAWIELSKVEATEFEIEQAEKTVRTREGDEVAITIESGKRRLRAEAHVIVVDVYGNEITNVMVVGQALGEFLRGRSPVDPSTLNLGRREVDAFDVLAQEAHEQALRQTLAEDLATLLGPAVLDPVLALVP